MRKFVFIFICFCCCYPLFSQSITPFVLSSRGDYFSNSSTSLSWTIGQIASTSLLTANNIVTQGFQQPYYYDPFNIPVLDIDSVDIQVFPNPASDFINIIYSTKIERKITFELLDLLGNELMPDIEKYSGISHAKLEINLSNLKAGIYFIRIVIEKSDINKTYKIVKIE